MNKLARVVNDSTGRQVYFDHIRCLAIIFVIAIHISNRINYSEFGYIGMVLTSIWRTIISCAVPLFLTISGYFFANKDVGSLESYLLFLKRQIPRVYVPCLIWSLPYFYWEVKSSGFSYVELFNLFFSGYSVYYFVLLICIFYLLLPLMQRLGRTKTGLCLSVVVSLMSAILWSILFGGNTDDAPPLMYSGFFFPMWMMFFVAGIYYGRGGKIRLTVSASIIFILLTILASILMTILQIDPVEIDFSSASHSKVLNYIYSFFVIVIVLNRIPSQTIHVNSIVSRFSAYVGRISYGIYLIHMYILLYLDLGMNRFFPEDRLPIVLLLLVIVLLSIALITLAKLIDNRLAFKFLGF